MINLLMIKYECYKLHGVSWICLASLEIEKLANLHTKLSVNHHGGLINFIAKTRNKGEFMINLGRP